MDRKKTKSRKDRLNQTADRSLVGFDWIRLEDGSWGLGSIELACFELPSGPECPAGLFLVF